MTQYSILHMTKYKELGGIGSHLDRKYAQHNIDSSKSHLNEDLSIWAHIELNTAIATHIEQEYQKSEAIRRDAVRAIGVVLTGSHEQMKKIESNQKLFNQWKEDNYQFACQEFGKSNIVRFSVHRDEKTPHIHCVFVPITKEGGLSAKSYMNGRDCLRAYQDRYGKAMEKFDLSRGLPVDVTQEAHISTSDYYRETSQLIRDAEGKTAGIKLSNALSLKQVKESVQGEIVRSYRLALDYQDKADQYERMYKSLSKQARKQELERVKRDVNLVQHVASMGYKVDTNKSCRTYAVMSKGGDKLVIRTSPNKGGHWVYMSAIEHKDRGTIVDLMLNRGYKDEEIRGLTSKHLDETVWLQVSSEQKRYITDKELQSRIALNKLLSVGSVNISRNYLEKRNISNNTNSIYKGNGLEVGHQAVFGLYQELNHHYEGRLCSTITYSFTELGERQKRFQTGLPRGLSVLKGRNNKVIIMESPIDALSHKQLYSEDNTYICTCGNLTRQIVEELRKVIEGSKLYNKELILSFDNDEAGKKMSNQVLNMSRELGATPKLVQPSAAKDWNDELTQKVITQKETRISHRIGS